MPDAKKLTDLEAQFVREYLEDLNASAACLRAGYKTRHPNALAAQVKAKPHVQAAISAAMEARARRTEISADWVLKNLKEVAERCLQAVPVTRFNREEKRQVQVEENGQGVWTFDASGAIRSLELIGKHRGMFKEQVDHTLKGSLVHKHLLCPRSEEILARLTGEIIVGPMGGADDPA